jgi:hypothetical protein
MILVMARDGAEATNGVNADEQAVLDRLADVFR